jgi:hypothetical protein
MRRFRSALASRAGVQSTRAFLFVLVALGLGSTGAKTTAPGGLRDPMQPAPASLGPSPLAPPDSGGHCSLCRDDPGAPIVPLTAAMADSLGRAFSSFNQTLLARVDSLLRAGSFGVPSSREATGKAHLLSRMLAVNSLHYMVQFAIDPKRIYEASEANLRAAFQRYSDPGLYPIVRMKRGRMGLGHICVQYDLKADLDSVVTVGGQKLRIHVETTELQGKPQRVLILELPTILFSVVELIICEQWTSQVEFVRSNGPPAPYDLYLFHDIDGMYVRKAGTHKPTALMFWCTPRDVNRLSLPRTPLVGECIYVPHLSLQLPSFIPDVGFKDLRLVDLPQPILSLSYLQEKRYPAWMQRAHPRGFKDWNSYGPIPPDVRLRFPDM